MLENDDKKFRQKFVWGYFLNFTKSQNFKYRLYHLYIIFKIKNCTILMLLMYVAYITKKKNMNISFEKTKKNS
jgi:hypothetical protein